MFQFIGGFVAGGFAGFLLCALLHVDRIAARHSRIPLELRDRRGQQNATFPLIDCDGVLVHGDRRTERDRRLRGVSHSA